MLILVILTGLLAAYPSEERASLTLDQQLIVACFELDVKGVVTCLRDGANVNGRFGNADAPGQISYYVARANWTPLLALAHAEQDRPRSFSGTNAHLDREVDIIVNILIAHGCRLDDDDGYGATGLSVAVYTNKASMAEELLRRGANPNTKTKAYLDGPNDVTPLHECRSLRIMQLLLDCGADPFAKDDEGRTPGDWLALNEDREFDLVISPKGAYIRLRALQERPKDGSRRGASR